MKLKPEHVAVIGGILDDIMRDDARRWTCRDCGATTSGISEVCEGCHEEFGKDGRPLMPLQPWQETP